MPSPCMYRLRTIILMISLIHESIRVEIKTELFNTKQNIYICLKGKADIPILQINKPLKLNEIESKASKLASFLNVPIKGI